MNLGWTEIILVGAIALLLFGPSKLPGLGRSLGEAIRGFKRGISEDAGTEKEAHQQISENKAQPLNKENVHAEEKDKNHQS